MSLFSFFANININVVKQKKEEKRKSTDLD